MRHNSNEITLIEHALNQLEASEFPLPGIRNPVHKLVFIKQVIDSIRRVYYPTAISQRPIDPDRADPSNTLFDPIRAAIIHKNNDDIDEACWLVFLFVHFGKHPRAGWRYVREVYGMLGDGQNQWTWANVSANPEAFRDWLRLHQEEITRGTQRGFGNHRKYQSMDADKATGTGAAVVSYVNWVVHHGGHAQLFQHAFAVSNGAAMQAFNWLYHSMNHVVSFGRTAKFDYLTMLGKLQLAKIVPGSAYLDGATGPRQGANLMLRGSQANELSTAELDKRLVKLAQYLGVDMQVIEDSLCNWQKSPESYRLFSG